MIEYSHSPDRTVNVFFAADDRYLPYLAVAISSLSAHASDKYIYNVNILTTNFSDESLKKIKNLVRTNVRLSTVDLKEKVKNLKEELALRLRDYYSEAIYYRMFIPSMFPELNQAVYLDSDIVVLDDVAKLFFTDLGNNLLGAVTDESVIVEPVFTDYVKKRIGLSRAEEYFNSGVLVMNLCAIREAGIEEAFLKLLTRYNFKTVAPDQDYLNYLCRDRVKYLPSGWNKHAIMERELPPCQLHLMHYNMFHKPWHYDGVQNEELFWNAARSTPFFEELLSGKRNYGDGERARDSEGAKGLLALAKEITEHDGSIDDIIAGIRR